VVLVSGSVGGRPARPVLRRGDDDRGAGVQVRPLPVLDSIFIGFPGDEDLGLPPPSFRAAQLGHQLRLQGHNLAEDSVRVRFAHHHGVVPQQQLSIADADRTDTEIRLTLPSDGPAQTNWAAGVYGVSVVCERHKNGKMVTRATNVVPLALAPHILSIAPASSPNNPLLPTVDGEERNITLTIDVSPHVVQPQAATLLLSNLEIPAAPVDTTNPPPAGLLTFNISHAPPGENQLATLRVDGVDSLPFMLEQPVEGHAIQPRRLVFDPAQMVSIS
jgi:hypothetical protein